MSGSASRGHTVCPYQTHGKAAIPSTLQGPLYEEKFIKGIVRLSLNNQLIFRLSVRKLLTQNQIQNLRFMQSLTHSCTLLCYPVFSFPLTVPLPFSLCYMHFCSYLKSSWNRWKRNEQTVRHLNI